MPPRTVLAGIAQRPAGRVAIGRRRHSPRPAGEGGLIKYVVYGNHVPVYRN